MDISHIIEAINRTAAVLFIACYSYQLFYLLVPFFVREKPHKPEKMHRFAVLIAARNEEKVIANLIRSIRLQDYPRELVDIYVVADNCTDKTAAIAAGEGAVVYERTNREKVGKGYALSYLIGCIERDMAKKTYDGYFVFDADNVLSRDFISAMNRTFSDGYEIVTSYRNSKNYGDNWITAGYGLWFLRESKYLNNARYLLGTSAAISGTGFLFSRGIIDACGGWQFFLLTEDIEFTIHNVAGGVTVGYCRNAMLYDEQPVKFSQSWRQRLRWAKGYLQVFGKYGRRLVRSFVSRRSFACVDMCLTILPAAVLTLTCAAVNGAAVVIGLLTGGNALEILRSTAETIVGSYVLMLFIGGVTTVTEWNNINTSGLKKILYTFTFPLFMMTYIPITAAALIKHVEWQPIEHNVNLSITELEPPRQGGAAKWY